MPTSATSSSSRASRPCSTTWASGRTRSPAARSGGRRPRRTARIGVAQPDGSVVQAPVRLRRGDGRGRRPGDDLEHGAAGGRRAGSAGSYAGRRDGAGARHLTAPAGGAPCRCRRRSCSRRRRRRSRSRPTARCGSRVRRRLGLAARAAAGHGGHLSPTPRRPRRTSTRRTSRRSAAAHTLVVVRAGARRDRDLTTTLTKLP